MIEEFQTQLGNRQGVSCNTRGLSTKAVYISVTLKTKSKQVHQWGALHSTTQLNISQWWILNQLRKASRSRLNSWRWSQRKSKRTKKQSRSQKLATSAPLKLMICCISETLLTILLLITKCCMQTVKTSKQPSCTWWINTSNSSSSTKKRRKIKVWSSSTEKDSKTLQRKEIQHLQRQLNLQRRLNWWMISWCCRSKNRLCNRRKTPSWSTNLPTKTSVSESFFRSITMLSTIKR